LLFLCGSLLCLCASASKAFDLLTVLDLSPEDRRQPYRITAQGLRVLRAKLATLRQFTKAGLGRLEAR